MLPRCLPGVGVSLGARPRGGDGGGDHRRDGGDGGGDAHHSSDGGDGGGDHHALRDRGNIHLHCDRDSIRRP